MATNYIERFGLGPFLSASNVPMLCSWKKSEESWRPEQRMSCSKSPEINNRESLRLAEGRSASYVLLLFRERKPTLVLSLELFQKYFVLISFYFPELRDAITSQARDNLVFGFTFAAKSTLKGFCHNVWNVWCT